MKKTIKNILLGLCLAQLTGCLPVDENLIDKGQITSNANYAQGLLMNAYQGLDNQYSFSCVATDDAVNNQNGQSLREIATGELTSQYNPLDKWNKYKYITYLNQFLSIVDDVVWKNDGSAQNEYYKRKFRGEALALRAIMHMYLLQAHAGYDKSGVLMGIPYITTFIAHDGNFNTPRLTFAESVAAIENDFNAAYTLLPFIYSNDPAVIPAWVTALPGYDEKSYLAVNGAPFKLRVQGQIVRGFQARLHLLAASKAFMNSQSEYKLALKYAAELCAQNNYALATDGVEFYNADNDKDNPEILWRASLSQSSGLEKDQFPYTLNGDGRVNPSQNLVDAFYKSDGYPINSASGVVYNPQDPYKNRDPRLDKYILFNNGKLGSKTITINTASKDGVNNVIDRSTRTGYYLKKHLRTDVVIPTSGAHTAKQHFNVYLRYTELYLIMAEALNEIGGATYLEEGIPVSSKDIIRKIRARALNISSDPYLDGITSTDDMRTLIQRERRLELCFEGFRFWDLRRYKASLTETVMGISNDGVSYSLLDNVEQRVFDGAKYYYMPLPYREVLKFNAITQNEGW